MWWRIPPGDVREASVRRITVRKNATRHQVIQLVRITVGEPMRYDVMTACGKTWKDLRSPGTFDDYTCKACHDRLRDGTYREFLTKQRERKPKQRERKPTPLPPPPDKHLPIPKACWPTEPKLKPSAIKRLKANAAAGIPERRPRYAWIETDYLSRNTKRSIR
jgi:tRNA(Ile2) C34 agmatinyltransferase TiaS